MTQPSPTCPACDSPLRPEMRFCNGCGQRVPASAFAPPIPVRDHEFELSGEGNRLFASQLLPGCPVSERGYIDCSPKQEFGYGGAGGIANTVLIVALAIIIPCGALVFKIAPAILLWMAATQKTEPTQGSENPDRQTSSQPAEHEETASSTNEAPDVYTDPAFVAYMSVLTKKVLHHWHPTTEESTKKIVSRFTVESDGKLADPRIVHSSDDEQLDEKALKALEDAAPFAPLPILNKKKIPSVTVEINFSNKPVHHHTY